VHVKTAAIRNEPCSKYQNSKYWVKKNVAHLTTIGPIDSFSERFGKPVTIATHRSKINGIINLKKTTHSKGIEPSILFPINKFIEVQRDANTINNIPSRCFIRLVVML
jgi:hypothetical protein